jgi:hypothetical protein
MASGVGSGNILYTEAAWVAMTGVFSPREAALVGGLFVFIPSV